MPDANADQVAYWNETVGHTWAELQTLMDAQLEPLGAAMLEALGLKPGERVLDVGCGCGATTLALARAVGQQGEAVGVDISAPMLAVARNRAPPSGGGKLLFREADAQTEDLGSGRFDAIYSRFGVMFFADPAAAFANLRRALAPGGRLAFVCWRAMAENPMFTAPMQAVLPHLPPPLPSDPLAPGPFAFADPERVRAILTEAGFADLRLAPLDLEISPGGLEEGLLLAQRIGPLGQMLRENPHVHEAAHGDLRTALAAHIRNGRVRFASATWLVTATT